jgi:penicillin-binding protein 1C
MTLPSSLGRAARRNASALVCASVLGALAWGVLRLAAGWSIHGAFPESTLVSDRNGAPLRLTVAADGQYRLWTALNEFPPEVIEAVQLKEDRSFWLNPGVDAPALARAAWHTLVVHDYRMGASTLTMQTARLAWNLQTVELPGKLVQIFGALALTALVSKADILEAYLNLAPCGGNVQGLGTASRVWFGKAPSRLNVAEALALAVLPQDPAHRNPSDPASLPAIEAARQRLAADWLRAHAGGSTLAAQLAMPLAFRRNLPFLAPHLVARVIAEHPDKHRLQSTIDLKLQRLVEGAIQRFTRRNASLGVNNAAALLVRADTMEVLASVGSADFHNAAIQGQVDGTRALRSPGSTLKPFLYGLALQQGLIHPLSILKDARVHFGGYNPDNFDNDFEGPIRAVDALVESRNVPAVILTGQVKHPDLYEFLQKAGLGLPYPEEHYGLSIILGGAEVTMTDLVRLYGSLAGPGNQAGTTRPLRDLLDDPLTPTSRLLTAESAWLVRKMLETKPRPDADEGWNASPVLADSAAEMARHTPSAQAWQSRAGAVAYKTGTSIAFRDAWSVGIADGYILAVWVGDFAGASNPEYMGLKTAAPLMFEIIDAWRAAGAAPGSDRDDPPPGIVFVPVCAVSGGIATDACPDVVLAPFIAGVSPIAPCSVHRYFPIDQTTGLRRGRDIPGVTKPVRYEVWPSDILELFAQAGLARTVPPPLDPGDGADLGPPASWVPQILSPVKGLTYRSDAADDRVPLAAAVGSDVRELWWFVDDKVVGRAARGETVLWKPVPGHHSVRVVDDAGRRAEVGFDVTP